MTDFDAVARKAAKAAFDVIRHIIAEHPDLFEKTNETHWAARDVLEIEITKHYADLEETFGLLVEVVKMQNAQRIHRESFMKFQDHVDANKHKTGIAVNARLAELFANPRIAALLAEKKG